MRLFFDVPAPRSISARALLEYSRRCIGFLEIKHSVNIVITGARLIKKLNKRFLGKNSVTDVITFEAGRPAGAPASEKERLSEIYVCLPEAKFSSRRLGHGVVRELMLLIAHGLLHLKGMNDDSASCARKMLLAGENLADRFATFCLAEGRPLVPSATKTGFLRDK